MRRGTVRSAAISSSTLRSRGPTGDCVPAATVPARAYSMNGWKARHTRVTTYLYGCHTPYSGGVSASAPATPVSAYADP